MTFLVILGLCGFAWYVMEPDERRKLLRGTMKAVTRARDLLIQRGVQRTPFDAALRTRTRHALVTSALCMLNTLVFLLMLLGPGALADPATLIAWGANHGPNTSNGEWTRLLASLFVHSGPLHFLVNVLALAQLGVILERLVGHVTFAVVYFAAGVLAGLVSLYINPVGVAAGASGAVFGLYGLLLAVAIWGLVHRSTFTVPVAAVKTLGPVAALFLLYNVAEGSVHGTAEWVGFAAGLAAGLLLTRDVATSKPPLRPVAAVAASVLVITVASAVGLRGIANVLPEIERLVEIEARIAGDYDKVVRQFRLGRMSARQLAQTIDRTIRPELEAAMARLGALTGVPPEHAALVSEAGTYLALRDESWRTRAEALKRGDMNGLRAADRTERASLEVFERIAAALGRSAG